MLTFLVVLKYGLMSHSKTYNENRGQGKREIDFCILSLGQKAIS